MAKNDHLRPARPSARAGRPREARTGGSRGERVRARNHNAGPARRHPARPCKGAVPRKHSHFFTADGKFGSRDWNGEQVDDGTYEVIDDRTFVVSKEFPEVTFHYVIEGDAITLDPVIPDSCLTFRCLWSVAVAYPGRTWRRVS
jgi:hypothetical protein